MPCVPLYSICRARQVVITIRIGILGIALTVSTGCAIVPWTSTTNHDERTTAWHQGRESSGLLNYALSLQGVPYRIGGRSPDEGFDCSGFVQHVYQRHGIPLPRTTTLLASALPSVAWQDLRPGDLVFFNTRGQPYSHVGIYLDRDHFIHAPGGRHSRTVRISHLITPYWVSHFSGARRPMRRPLAPKNSA
jgi:cell wall-associated NlpC family hydrolase